MQKYKRQTETAVYLRASLRPPVNSFLSNFALIVFLSLLSSPLAAEDAIPLPGTEPLVGEADYSDLMLTGFESYLRRETEKSIAAREALWHRDFSSAQAYEKSIQPNRERFARMIGVVDPRQPIEELEYIGGTKNPFVVGESSSFTVYAVRWPVLEGVDGEGLLLVPKSEIAGTVICLPDADQTPEMLLGMAPGLDNSQQFARLLAESNWQVIIPTLIDRQDTWSGDPAVWMTNCTHREWVYRPAFELGRHIIGYEVQKVLALVDWCAQVQGHKIGVAGYGEGGLIAFYSAAVDSRIQAALVSGYFDSRQDMWQEPIYRNVFGLLHEFGDAEIASLIAPRPLLIEHSPAPAVEGPPPARDARRDVAAPGRIRTPTLETIQQEVARFEKLCPKSDAFAHSVQVIPGEDGGHAKPISTAALTALISSLSAGHHDEPSTLQSEPPKDLRIDFDPAQRQHRQLQQLIDHTQLLLARSAKTREAFWAKANIDSLEQWSESCAFYRDYLWDEILGRVALPTDSFPAQTRLVFDKPEWTGYEVKLNVNDDIFVWGFLLVPKDIKPGQRRPVVVCQHGLEGLPTDVITDDPSVQGYAYYKGFAAKLAERGFVTFAPHHYYRGGDRFRQAQRMANPIKKTLFALTIAQHERLLDWLTQLPFVDEKRIGFYGLSYGGFSAIRLPPIVQRYALSINSAEFNDMALKKASVHDQYSYPFHRTYEVFEFNLANTFGYSDLAGLIAPRSFMVERGHQDGVAPDEWVAAEYAKVRRRYAQLGIPDRTRIEFFNGPHTINGVGTFQFLEERLGPVR